jgi:hypothetical protein
MSSIGYATQKSAYTPVARRPRGPRRKEIMKLTLKQRFYNWLTDRNSDSDYAVHEAPMADTLSSNGLRFNMYKAHGGFVIETRFYDERNDRNTNKMYVITEDKDLGEELGKIITMESLR